MQDMSPLSPDQIVGSNCAQVSFILRHDTRPDAKALAVDQLLKAGQTIERLINEPIPMLLHCPRCGKQHIDEIDKVNNPGWENPPHTSHKCLGCGCVWRPCDRPTEGVHEVLTKGRTDSWPGGDAAPAREPS